MGQINTNNYPTVNSLADADLLIVENATNGTGTTTPKQLRENAIGTDTLQTSSQTVTGAINELKHEIDLGAGVARYDVNTITSGYLGQFSGSANLLLLHLTTDGTADATNGYMMMLSYSRPVARFAYGRLVDTGGAAYKQDVYADNTIICTISGSGEGTESDPVQVVILGIINAGFMLTPTAVVSDRDIQDGQGNTLSVLAEALTKTASGNPVVITDCAGGKARSLKTTIEAIQDLHGLPFPYVGGAYKNKYKMRTTSATVNGITATPNSDQTIQLSGTATGGSASIPLCDNLTEISTLFGNGGTFTMSLKEGTYGGTLNVSIAYVETQGGTTKYLLPNTPTEIPAGSIAMSSNLYVAEGTAVQSLSHFAIQLEVGNTATSFAPYSNICPISGRTEAVITRSDGDEISEDFTIQLGTTVYGADINWDTGVMTVNTTFKQYAGGNDENWQKERDNWNVNNLNVFYIQLSETGESVGDILPPNLISDKLVAMGISPMRYTDKYGGATLTDNGAYLEIAVDFSSVADLKAWLATNPLQIEYKLATPTTIQLTPTQLEMLKGYNRVSIDNGSIELGYIAKLT